jgi:predicted RNA-binding protein
VADLIRQILSDQADIELVATVPPLDDLDAVAGAAEIDLVITTYADSPQPRILSIEDDGRRVCMYTRAPERRELGVLTPETLIEFIRAAREST